MPYGRIVAALTACAVATSAIAQNVDAPPGPIQSQAGQAVADTSPLAAGTLIRLMVMDEVTSRYANVGDRFKLRVDESVTANGEVIVPVGTIAWGEVTGLDQSGAVGKRGQLGAKLLYLDLPTGRVPLRGEQNSRGGANTAGFVLGVLSFGLGGLLSRGGNAKLKAGAIFTGYVDK